MAQISTVALTNTFDFWRLRTNELAARLNQFATNESALYANTITANNVLVASGNTRLGASGKKTIVTGLLAANGRMTITTNLAVSGNTSSNKATITSSLTVSGNTVLGAANKRIDTTGVLAHTGNMSVSANLSITNLLANNSLGSANYVLKTNGTSVFWGPITAISLDEYLQVANAVATYTTKSNPATSGLHAHTGRTTISTNLAVSGNTSSNKSTITSSLVVSGNTKLGAAGKKNVFEGWTSANGVLEVTKRLVSTGNNVLGAAGKTTRIDGTSTANGYLRVVNRFDVSGNTNLGAAGKKTVINGQAVANGTMAINTNLTVTGNTSANKSTVTSLLTVSGNTTLGGAGKVITSTGHINHTGRQTISTNLTVSGNAQVLSLGVGTTPGTNGSIRATENITAYYSDERLKEQITIIPDALAKVNSLRGFYFYPNEIARDFGYKYKREVGVSAQEVEAILPEIVTEAPISDKYKTVYYEKLIPLLIEAIKELDARVKELENGS